LFKASTGKKQDAISIKKKRAQVLEHLPSKHEALNSNPITTKKRKKERKKYRTVLKFHRNNCASP
jgi:hypothetical protein